MAKAFRMTVKAIKRTREDAPEVDFLGTRQDLPGLLPDADFIVLTLPGTKDTEDFLGKREFEMMKPGVHIVNVGRGSAIDEQALYEALKTGRVAGAGIDTWWVYPKSKDARSNTLPSNSPLWEFDNVVFSPHRASHVAGRETERVKDLADILNSIVKGMPRNVVDLEEGY
jgi:phosphoglycerate dehydrogenase-like enzyme